MLNALQITLLMKLIFDLAVALQCNGRESEEASKACNSIIEFCSNVPLIGEAPDGFTPSAEVGVMTPLTDALRLIDDDR